MRPFGRIGVDIAPSDIPIVGGFYLRRIVRWDQPTVLWRVSGRRSVIRGGIVASIRGTICDAIKPIITDIMLASIYIRIYIQHITYRGSPISLLCVCGWWESLPASLFLFCAMCVCDC